MKREGYYGETAEVLSRYFSGIKELPILSVSKEAKVAGEAKEGDVTAKEKLIISNLRFVVKVALKYRNKGMPLADLISEGNLGLIRAAQTYDPDRKVRFISYAIYWIKQSIIKSIAERAYLFRLPLSWNSNISKIARLNDLAPEMKDFEKIGFFANEMEISEESVVELINISKSKVSIEQDVFDSGVVKRSDSPVLQQDTLTSDPQKIIIGDFLKKVVNQSLDELEGLEKEILAKRYGLKDSKPTTLETLGKQYGLTKERIRQIENKALKTIKQRMNSMQILDSSC